ncbi:putative immunoglobulin-blocking virulence protein [Mycoplasmopsis hyopharyngis]|uniref:putative immunoglobulin-blocking virulence protein n=1 Tax=Mycoplasmopsis hyopharyngis TaxID=29558 RepID=UPI003873075B
MKLFKKRKNKVLFLSVLVGAAASIGIGSFIYSTTADTNYSRDLAINKTTDSKLINKNNLDLNNTESSTRDNNIREIPNTPIVEPKPKPKPPVVIVNPPEEKPKPNPIPKVEPDPIPTPIPTPVPPKEEPKPQPPKTTPEPPAVSPKPTPGRIWTKIFINGVEVEAEITPQPERETFESDKANGITNPNPYQNIIVNELHSIKVTEELRKKTLEKALKSGDSVGLFDDHRMKHVIDEMADLNKAEQLALGTANDRYNWENLLHRYKRLLDSPNVVNFLKEPAKSEFPTKKFNSDTQRYIWLIGNLDQSKFTKLAKGAEDYLAKGLTIDPRNSYINENGEIDSNSFSPPSDFNTVTSRLARDNAKRRVFGYNSYYGRNSGSILEGTYEGWNKTDITNSSEFQKYGVGNGDGIKISKLTRTEPKQGERNEGIVVEIDAANPNGYQKTKKLIEELKANNVEITSYRIKNMGSTDAGQQFKDILKALPDNLPQLELFFSANAANTSCLIALKDKKIKELSLYTLGNSLLEEWSYNPLAFKNVEWMNTVDYNVSFEYPKNVPIATRITFNTLAFDAENYETENDFTQINLGLRMVYFVRNNEPFFQGGLGPGLKPDHNEGDNSYPTGLDFSRVPKIKSLRGLVFNDINKPSNKPRKIRNLKLFNDKDYFEISGAELNSAGFENMTIGEPGPPRTKITFSNGANTTKIRITSSDQLSGSALTNLGHFFQLNDTLKYSKTIQVPAGAVALKSQLESAGYKVETANNIQYT